MNTESVVQSWDKLVAAAEEHGLYAILDGASMPGLLTTLTENALTYACLMPGELESELAQVAPYLVRLDGQLSFVNWLVSEGGGQHWGIFLRTRNSFRTLRQHSRAQFQVYGPNEDPLFFRYYDPRVLRAFLPTCRTRELLDFFGPVEYYLAESESGDTLSRYEVKAGTLQYR